LGAKTYRRIGGVLLSKRPVSASEHLKFLLEESNLTPLTPGQSACFEDYLALILRWNARVNLTAIRDEEGILKRHFVESIACAQALPAGIDSLLDFGSGAGFPGIPIAICRPEIAVTLAESQNKKAAFLSEAVRVLGLSTKVHPARAEALGMVFDCITLRAVDHMGLAVKAAAPLVRPSGWLALMTTNSDLVSLQSVVGNDFVWSEPIIQPGGEDHLLGLGVRVVN